MKPVRLFAATLASLGLAACSGPVPLMPATESAAPVPASVQQLATATVTGVLTVPAGVVSAGSGNVVSAGSGNVVSAGSGNVVSAGALNRRVLALSQSPLAGAEVFAADASGNPLPGTASVLTDEQGRFTLSGLPAERVLVIAARVKTSAGKPALFKTLVLTRGESVSATIDAASTMVATATIQKDATLTGFDPVAFERARAALAPTLEASKLPDFADDDAVAGVVQGLTSTVEELGGVLNPSSPTSSSSGAGTTVGGAVEQVGSTAGETVDTVGGAVEEVGGNVGGAVEDVTGAVGDTADDVSGAVGDTVDGVTDAVGGLTGGGSSSDSSDEPDSDSGSDSSSSDSDSSSGIVGGITGGLGL